MKYQEYKTLILERLWRKAKDHIGMNAALGYEIDASLPAPEVFEQPDWEVLWAPPGCRKLAFPFVEGGFSPMGEVNASTEFGQACVEPIVNTEVEFHFDPGQKRWYGLGVHVPTRRWIIFHDV